MKNLWKTLSQKVVHKNPWYSIRKDEVIRPNGKKGVYYVQCVPDCVFVVPVTKQGKIIFNGQFRYTTQVASIEVVAGAIDPGETPLTSAKRELQEESGLVAKKWTFLGKFQVANGKSDQWEYFYLAEDVVLSGKMHEQAEEGILFSQEVSFTQAFAMIAQKKITDSHTALALFLAQQHLQRK